MKSALIAAFVTVCVASGVGVIFLTHKKTQLNETKPAEAAAQVADPSEVPYSSLQDPDPKAAALFEEAKNAYTSGNLELEKRAYEELLQKYPLQRSGDGDEGGELSFGEIAKGRLLRIECSLKNEVGAQNPPRTSEETLTQAISAIKDKNKEALLKLISCEVSEGVPASEYDQTSRDLAARHLLGETSGDGYGSIAPNSKPYVKAIGKEAELGTITNGEDFISFTIEASAFAPQTNRIKLILWGPWGE